MLNIQSEDYRLRKEVTHLLSEQSITSDMLTFRDQIDIHNLNQKGRLSMTLVDHNVLRESDRALELSVVEVIDHRKVERQETDR